MAKSPTRCQTVLGERLSGVDSIGKGQYLNGHDDLQIAALTWSHKFDDRLHTLTESL